VDKFDVVLGNLDVCRTIVGVGEDSKIHGVGYRLDSCPMNT